MHRGPVISIASRGSGVMGDVADRSSICRYSLDGRFTPIHLRGKFSGGTGSATLTLSVDSRIATNARDATLLSITSVGTSGDAFINHRWPADEAEGWIFEDGDELVLTWPNPDIGNMLWNIDFGLARVIGDAT